MSRRISHFRLERELGRGGAGRVYRAYDTTLDRIVVLKLLNSELVSDRESRTRLLREARLASALDHQNICTIYEIAEADGQYFIAMQYVRGKTLKQLIKDRPLKLESIVSIALQVGDALAAAHAQGIVHRDIKSANIMITPRGKVKVLDFGLARLLTEKDYASSGVRGELTRQGSAVGTPSYMSPEHARGERVDHRGDIFSFGVVLYEMATGHTPFRGKSQVETMHAVIHDPHPPVAEQNKQIAPELVAVIDRALAKKASDRYQSVPHLMDDMRQVGFLYRVAPGGPDGMTAPFIRPRRHTWLGTIRTWVDRVFAGNISSEWVTRPMGELVVPKGVEDREFSLAGGSPKTLAVLPYRNLSGDATADVYTLSLADGLTTDLAKFSSLVVRSSQAVSRYQNAPVDPGEVGRELDVEFILTGNFLKAGDRVRVTTQLIKTSEGTLLWSEKIDIPDQDVLSIQDRLTKRIVNQLTGGDAPVDPIELLKDDNEDMRLDAVRTLQFSHDPRTLWALIEALRDHHVKVKSEAVHGLVRRGSESTGPVIELLHTSIDEGDFLTARFAAKALGLIGDRKISPVLLDLLTCEDSFVACEAALALGRLRESKAVPELIQMLEDPSGNKRFAAAEALGQITHPMAREALLNRLSDGDEGVRAKARWALSRQRKWAVQGAGTGGG